jgi:hypothetical protein
MAMLGSLDTVLFENSSSTGKSIQIDYARYDAGGEIFSECEFSANLHLKYICHDGNAALR